MKIGHPAEKTLPLPPATTTAQPAATDAAKSTHATHVTQAASAAAPVAAEASAKVAISSTASTLLSGGSSAEFDAEKVGRIGDAIAAGTFKANPEAIADKLIANAQELLGKGKAG